MPEIFLGDLANVKLFDILKPIFSGKKTGKIIFKGKEDGELYLELGNITHAKTNNAVGEYAFFNLMGLKVGKASFEPDEVPLKRTISISTEQLLLNWSYRKQEWDKIKEVVPSPNTIGWTFPTGYSSKMRSSRRPSPQSRYRSQEPRWRGRRRHKRKQIGRGGKRQRTSMTALFGHQSPVDRRGRSRFAERV